MGERALEVTRRRAADMQESGETPDLVAILREECAMEPRAVYDRAVRAIAETAARSASRGKDDGEDAIMRWALGVPTGASLYLALGDAIAWLRENPPQSGGEAGAVAGRLLGRP